MKRNYDFSKGVPIKGPIKSKSQLDRAIKKQKELTSILLDSDIVAVAKRKAQDEGVGYLTWLNRRLRSSVLGEKALEERVEKLEQAVFKKKTSQHLIVIFLSVNKFADSVYVETYTDPTLKTKAV